MNKHILNISVGLFLILNQSSFAQQQSIKSHLQNQGYQFIEQIDAPADMTGWAGYKDEYPSTVFISNDQKYYIVGDLFDANDKNLTEEAIQKHVKGAVLNEVWNSLEKSKWIQDGKNSASKIIYVFVDPNCPYCHTFWNQARPWVNSGKVQLRHIMVGVIRPGSKGQAATILSAKNPEQIYKEYNLSDAKQQLKEMKNIPPTLSKALDENEKLMEKYGFYATPALIWKDQQGNIQSQQGAPKDIKLLLD